MALARSRRVSLLCALALTPSAPCTLARPLVATLPRCAPGHRLMGGGAGRKKADSRRYALIPLKKARLSCMSVHALRVGHARFMRAHDGLRMCLYQAAQREPWRRPSVRHRGQWRPYTLPAKRTRSRVSLVNALPQPCMPLSPSTPTPAPRTAHVHPMHHIVFPPPCALYRVPCLHAQPARMCSGRTGAGREPKPRTLNPKPSTPKP